jgi:hypothetical protein
MAARDETTSRADERRRARTAPGVREWLQGGGWHVVSSKGGNREGGITAHRGVLHPDEYVDSEALQGQVERELGFTYEQVRSVYRQGPLSATQRGLRARIDARLMAVGNLTALGRIVGIDRDVLARARARARLEVACAWCSPVAPHQSSTCCPSCLAALLGAA